MTDDRPWAWENPPEWPNPEWTPKQQENYETHMQEVYEEIDSELGRIAYRNCWRPKQRNEGKLTRDHVQLGTSEDYIVEHVEDFFDPWGSMVGIMMREIGSYDVSTDALDEAQKAIVRAKLRVLADNDPERAVRLATETEAVAQLYGVTDG